MGRDQERGDGTTREAIRQSPKHGTNGDTHSFLNLVVLQSTRRLNSLLRQPRVLRQGVQEGRKLDVVSERVSNPALSDC